MGYSWKNIPSSVIISVGNHPAAGGASRNLMASQFKWPELEVSNLWFGQIYVSC